MSSFFPWLDKIFEYIWQFVPKPYLVIWTHRAVRYRRGGKPVLVMPGVRWYWPLTTLVKVINITWRAEEFKSKSIMTKDGITVACGYTMVYRVKNPVRADSSVDDYQQTIGEIGEAYLRPIIGGHTFDELKEMNSRTSDELGSLDLALMRNLPKDVRKYGIQVSYCRVHTIARARNLFITHEGDIMTG
jgi:regulator of protease activity HflC (stomatin/prohibitin superfamily)